MRVVHSLKVCVVDDCKDALSTLCEGLEYFGYQVVPAHSGEEGLRICQTQKVDLVLLDIKLPDIDGHEVCRQLKANLRTRDIPVIFVSGLGSSEDVKLGYELGAVDYVFKPYTLASVMIQVEAALRTRQNISGLVSGPFLITDPVYTDRLTGLRNRKFLMERLQEEAEKACRYHYPLSSLLFDLDGFSKEVEQSEDKTADLLLEMAIALRNSSRTSDILARYDDTQFAAVLPHTCLPNAIVYANKIRRAMSEVLPLKNNGVISKGLSFGIITSQEAERPPSAEELLSETMRLLLLAKSGAPEHVSACLYSAS
jgi:diguanylate cyclase (GGDEF)-like protein